MTGLRLSLEKKSKLLKGLSPWQLVFMTLNLFFLQKKSFLKTLSAFISCFLVASKFKCQFNIGSLKSALNFNFLKSLVSCFK